MAGNTFGTLFRLTTFGESHGTAIGGIIDGCPAGLAIDAERIQLELDRRKPGQSAVTTQRNEEDKVELLSGIFEGKTLGTPIGFIIRNKDHKSSDYDHISKAYRPSHADFTYDAKYGIRDYRGGGRSSARETACRVAAGAIARQLLETSGIQINAFVSQAGDVKLKADPQTLDLNKTYTSIVRCPHPETAALIESHIRDVAAKGDTIGGIVSLVVSGLPAGLGEPVFDRLPATLGHAMLSINAVKGFEFGSGFAAAAMRGSQHNDIFTSNQGKILTTTNHSGGVQGGISNGMPLSCRIAFKPVSTLMQKQKTVDQSGRETFIEGRGRHDACVLPRAVPVVEAMAALAIADAFLLSRVSKL